MKRAKFIRFMLPFYGANVGNIHKVYNIVDAGRYIRKSGGMLLPRVRLMLEADTGRCATIGAQWGAQGARALSWGAVGAALSRYN